MKTKKEIKKLLREQLDLNGFEELDGQYAIEGADIAMLLQEAGFIDYIIDKNTDDIIYMWGNESLLSIELADYSDGEMVDITIDGLVDIVVKGETNYEKKLLELKNNK